MCLGVVGNKPINYAKADVRGTLKHRDNLCDIFAIRIKALERVNNEFLLTVNLSTTGLGVRLITKD